MFMHVPQYQEINCISFGYTFYTYRKKSSSSCLPRRSGYFTPLYSVVDFVQIHHSPIIPNTIHPSFSWSTPTPCSWFLMLHCPSNKLFHFHSLHVPIPSQSTFSNLLSQLCQFLSYVNISYSFLSCYTSKINVVAELFHIFVIHYY
jgi:hypothetical protein